MDRDPDPFPDLPPGAAVLTALCLGAAWSLLFAGCGQEPTPEPDVTPKNLFAAKAPRLAARSLLVVGDSLSINLGAELERVFAGSGELTFERHGLASSGLSRPELLNWPDRLAELTRTSKPQAVIIMIGANDVMPLPDGAGGKVYFESERWETVYAGMIRRLIGICREANPSVRVFWVGAPPMADPALDKGVRRVNAVTRRVCLAEPDCRFIDTFGAFADQDGAYARHALNESGTLTALRQPDGVHLTDIGGRVLAGVVLDALGGAVVAPDTPETEAAMIAPRLYPPADPETARRLGADKPPAGPAGDRRSDYQIRPGDTLLSVAKKLGVEAKALRQANPDLDPRALRPGTRLKVPREGRRN